MINIAALAAAIWNWAAWGVPATLWTPPVVDSEPLSASIVAVPAEVTLRAAKSRFFTQVIATGEATLARAGAGGEAAFGAAHAGTAAAIDSSPPSKVKPRPKLIANTALTNPLGRVYDK